MKPAFHFCQFFLAGLVVMWFPLETVAGDWQIFPRLNVSESYTDNVFLTERDTDGDLITTVMPGLTLRGTSARLTSNIDYNLQYLDYVDNGDLDDVFHQLQGDGQLTVIDDFLYFSAASRLSQQNTNNLGRFARSNRSRTGNRSSVLFYEYGPSVRHRLGSWALFQANYTRNSAERTQLREPQIPGAVILPDETSEEETLQASVSSGPRVPRTPMSVSYTMRDQTSTNRRNGKLERVNATVGYQVNRQLQLTAEGGAEFNDFETVQRFDRSGPSWFLGGIWTPTPRTTIDGAYGQRVFGKTFRVSADHTMRRVLLSFNYGEDLRTTNQFQSELELVPLEDAFGQPILEPGFDPEIPSPLDVPSLATDIVLSSNMSASVSYQGRRRTFGIAYANRDNEFQQSGLLETNRDVSVYFTHRLTPAVVANVGGFWRDSDRRGDSNKTISVTSSLRFSLGRHLRLNLRYAYIDGGGRAARGDFTENVVTADVAYIF